MGDVEDNRREIHWLKQEYYVLNKRLLKLQQAVEQLQKDRKV